MKWRSFFRAPYLPCICQNLQSDVTVIATGGEREQPGHTTEANSGPQPANGHAVPMSEGSGHLQGARPQVDRPSVLLQIHGNRGKYKRQVETRPHSNTGKYHAREREGGPGAGEEGKGRPCGKGLSVDVPLTEAYGCPPFTPPPSQVPPLTGVAQGSPESVSTEMQPLLPSGPS